MMLAAALWEDRTGKCSWAGKALPSARLNFSRTSTSHQRVGGRVLSPRAEDGRHQGSPYSMISACSDLSSLTALGWQRTLSRHWISIPAPTKLCEAVASWAALAHRRARARICIRLDLARAFVALSRTALRSSSAGGRWSTRDCARSRSLSASSSLAKLPSERKSRFRTETVNLMETSWKLPVSFRPLQGP